MVESVVVGFNGSAAAWAALRWAADEAGTRHAPLEVVCCPADTLGPDVAYTHQQLDEAARVAGHRGLQIQIHASLVDGHPGDVLVERSRGAAMMVLGRHDPETTATGAESLIDFCKARAACPVIVVESTSEPDHIAADGPVARAT